MLKYEEIEGRERVSQASRWKRQNGELFCGRGSVLTKRGFHLSRRFHHEHTYTEVGQESHSYRLYRIETTAVED